MRKINGTMQAAALALRSANFSKAFPKVLFLAAALFSLAAFFSCENSSDSPSPAILQGAASGQNASNPSPAKAKGGEQCVTFRGSVRTGGALPASYAKALEGLGFGGTEEGVEGISKSARPDVTVNGTSIEHFAVATPNSGEPVEGTFASPSSTTFEMPLAIGKKWNIVCGIRNVSGDKKIIMSDSFQMEVTVSNSVLSHVFTLTPYTETVEGVAPPSGDVALSVKFVGSAVSDRASVSASWEDSTLPALAVNGLAPALITASSVPVGNHRLAIFFRDSNGVSVYESVQVVTVLNGLTTETWMPESGEAAISSSGLFVVNDDVIKGAASDRIYVGKPAVLASNDSVRASDSNSGSAYSPLETLGAAFNKIQSAGSGSKDFKIFVSGETVGNATLDAAKGTHARSITIEGLDDLDESLKPKSALKGIGGGSVFTIASNVPVTIKNLKITGGIGAGQGGGISMASGSDLTLDSGALVTQNSATWQGGGVYNGGGSLKIKKGAAISGNWITSARENGSDGGAGLFMYGNSAACVMTGGEISDNNKNPSYNDKNVRGGGVRLGGSARMTLSGGSVSGNFSRNLGGNFFIDSAFLDISGDAKICQGRVDTSSSDDDAWGGALYVEGNSKVTMTGGEISGNTAKAKSSNYACAGVYLLKEFEMTGGVIEGNVVEGGLSSGGAFRVGGLLTIGGSAKIPYGGGEGKNDVYVCKDGDAYKVVQVAASGFSYAASDSAPAAVLAPQDWNRNYAIIKAPSGSDIGAYTPYFKTIDPDFYFGRLSGTVDTAKLKAALCVSNKPSGVDPDDPTGAVDSNDRSGTKSQPFKTIAFALTKLSGGEPDEIIIDYDPNGAAFGPQEIPDTFTTTNCSALTIRGANGLNLDGTPKDILNASGTRNAGSVLTVKSAVPITIKDLKITGGNCADAPGDRSGGGIYLTAGELTLADGVLVVGNYASYGGGVYVKEGASLFMNGTSYIGDKTQTTASGDTLGSACSNSASYGGGIYNSGKVYLGYKKAGASIQEAEWTGGVCRNYVSDSGGGIYNRTNGDLKMRAGTVSYNRSNNYNGGGLCASSSEGHGIELLGGELKENYAGRGGAVYVESAFSMQGSPFIPYGLAGEKSYGKNDIYLADGKTIKVAGDLTLLSGESEIAAITPVGVKRTRKILSASSEDLINDNKDKFALTSDNDGWQKNYVYDSGHYAELNSPVYVVGTQNSDSTKPDDTWGWGNLYNNPNGTKTSPYASVAAALGCAELASATEPNTIIIAGTLKGAQTIGTTSISELSLKGYKTATSSAMIDAGGATDAGSALTVNASGKTVTIQDLTITGGNAENGGGINLAAGTVTLTNGANIVGNQATNGGGVYLAGSDSTLYMKGTSVIGDKNEYTASGNTINLNPTSQTGSGCANKADNGGGIYCNGGNVYVGCDNSGLNTTISLAAAGGLRRNYAGNGGGVYIAGGTFMTASGQISYNWASSGAGVYVADGAGHKIAGTVDINNNKAGNEGGGLYIGSGSTVSMSGSAKIEKNNAVSGGGASLLGTLNMSAGTIGGDSPDLGNTSSSSGGGVNIGVGSSSPYPCGTFNMSGGTISYNSCGNNGGGVSIGSRTPSSTTYNGTFSMSGGTVSNNTARAKGGAVLQFGKFNISGSASIPYGVTSDGTTTKSPGYNDVYLFKDTNTITVASASLSGGTTVATVTPTAWKRGTNIIDWGVSATDAQKTTIKGQIKLSQDDSGWERDDITSGGKNYTYITSPIYVADATYPLSGFGAGKTKANGGNGTSASPYDSIAEALKDTDLASVKKIVVAGTVKGAQTISGTLSTDTLTIEGYTEGGVTSSLNGGFSSTSSTKGRPLTVSSAATVTIQNLTITGGYASGSTDESKRGGGVYVSSGAAVNLADGAVVKGNHADNEGGGVYVESGAYFAAYGTSVIGDSSATAPQFYPGVDANQAKYGAGIYNQGTLCFGKSINKSGTESGTASWTGGLLGNTAFTSDGGAIWTSGATNLYDGNIKFNYSMGNGGAIYIAENTSSVTMSGGTIFKNTAYDNGGAVYISSGATFNMSGGTMGGKDASNNDLPNKVTNYSGGAIYQGGTFNISASAYIYPGSEKTNDVYLPENKYVMLGATSLSAYTGTDKLTITPAVWKRGTTFLGGTNVAGNYTKFKCSDSEWSVVQSSTVGKIDADIYVAPTSSTTTVDGVTYGKGAAATAGGRGTKAKPYSTIADAVAQCWGGPKDTGNGVSRVINIVGTITGAQEIASTVTTSKARAIILKGVNTSATLNGGMSSTSATKKSTLTLSTAVPVTIQSLKITGGYASGSADADRSGGGINITAGTVTLSDNAKIYENYVASTSTSGRAKGAGLYVASGARLNISSSSAAIYSNGSVGIDGGGIYNAGTVDMTNGSIYSNTSGSEEDVTGYGGGVDNAGTFYMSGSASIYSNTSNEAGGIYNSGTLYLGRSASNASATLSGSITKNAAKAEDAGTGGGAIYNAKGGTITMTSGTIGGSAANKNTAVHQGGAILNYGTFNMSGGTISYNEAAFGGGVYNEVLNSSAGTVTLSGGTISDNKAIKPYGDGDDYGGNGGGVYTGAGMTMSGGSIYGNTAAKDGGGVYSGDAIVMSGGSIYGNKAAKNGGGVFTEGMLYMSETAVIGNSGASGYATSESACSNYAAGDGGGVYLAYDSGIVLGANAYPWSSNKKELTGGIYYNYASGSGGGIYNDSNDGMYLYTGNVCKNGAGVNGGGVCSQMKEFEMSGGTIDGNYAVNGGGIYFVGNTIDSTYFYPTLSGGTISNNAVGENGYGGGIYIGTKNSLRMSGGTISGNTATASGGRGGGVYIQDSTANLFMSKNALIGDTGTSMAFNTTGEGYSNKATQGGGIYSNGGGVYIGYKDASNAEAMTSDSYGVRHNSTTGTSGEGGGVYANGGKVKVASGGLSFNFAYKNAGGIYAKTASGNGEISDVTIYGNLAGKKGGAVYLDAGCYFNITGGTISNNTAGRDTGASASDGGGAVFMANNANTTLNISGGTFSSNSVYGSAQGGAIYFRAGKLNISGGAKITTSSTTKANDVYLYSKSCNLQPGQTFNGNGTNTPVAIYLGWEPTAGDAIITGSYVGSHYARFKIISPVGWKIATTGKAQAN